MSLVLFLLWWWSLFVANNYINWVLYRLTCQSVSELILPCTPSHSNNNNSLQSSVILDVPGLRPVKQSGAASESNPTCIAQEHHGDASFFSVYTLHTSFIVLHNCSLSTLCNSCASYGVCVYKCTAFSPQPLLGNWTCLFLHGRVFLHTLSFIHIREVYTFIHVTEVCLIPLLHCIDANKPTVDPVQHEAHLILSSMKPTVDPCPAWSSLDPVQHEAHCWSLFSMKPTVDPCAVWSPLLILCSMTSLLCHSSLLILPLLIISTQPSILSQ